MSHSRFDYIHQFLDWGDHTVTVDAPHDRMGHRWVGADDHRSTETSEQGWARMAEQMTSTAQLLNRVDNQHFQHFHPAATGVLSLPRFATSLSAGANVWRGDIRDRSEAGDLPVVRRLHETGVLGEEDAAELARHAYESRHAISERIFHRGDNCAQA